MREGIVRSFSFNPQFARQDALRSELAQLRSSGDAIQAAIDAAVDLKVTASVCAKSWLHVESTTVFLHHLVLEDNVTSDARAADPLEAMRTYLASAESQVKGVMFDEYELGVAQKRLSMAIALAHTTLDLLSDELDDIAQRQQSQVDETQRGSASWRGYYPCSGADFSVPGYGSENLCRLTQFARRQDQPGIDHQLVIVP